MATREIGFGGGERAVGNRTSGWGSGKPGDQPTTTATAAVAEESRGLKRVSMITPEMMVGKISRFLLVDFEGETILRIGPHKQHRDMIPDIAAEIKKVTGKVVDLKDLGTPKYVKGGGKLLYEPNFEEGKKCIFVYGDSLLFGEADYSVAVPLLREAFPDFKVFRLEDMKAENRLLVTEIITTLNMVEKNFDPTLSYEKDVKPRLKELVADKI
jgi:hypothetical protein